MIKTFIILSAIACAVIAFHLAASLRFFLDELYQAHENTALGFNREDEIQNARNQFFVRASLALLFSAMACTGIYLVLTK